MLSQHNQKIIIQKFALNVACPQRRATLRANIFVTQITWICSATAIFALNVARLWGQATLRANIFHVQNTCPQSRLPSKSSALKVVCPQSRLPSMSPALNVAGSTSRAQRRLPSMSHSRMPYATLRADDIEGSDIEPTTLRADDFEGRRLWGQTTLRADDFEGRRLWGQVFCTLKIFALNVVCPQCRTTLRANISTLVE